MQVDQGRRDEGQGGEADPYDAQPARDASPHEMIASQTTDVSAAAPASTMAS